MRASKSCGGATDPHSLGRQLAVIYDGATALSTSCNGTHVITDARRAAATLIDTALQTQPAARRAPRPRVARR